jgi:DNA-binding transcriptional ArsR family regulator/uncharacterized protein YndB with AHSA1/START domain
VVPLRRDGLDDPEAPLWRALSDPTRRRILDLLRERPRTTGQIAGNFKVSRIAVMRHLDVLAGAGLVTSRKRGRERWHYINAVALERLHSRWFEPHAASWASRLLRLQRTVEAEAARVNLPDSEVDVALDVEIGATPAEVFSALTEDPGGWWGHPFLSARAMGLSLEPRLGGALVEQWEQGGAVVAYVTGWQADTHLGLTGPFHGVVVGAARFDLAPTELGTLLKFSFRAVGAADPAYVEAMGSGWTELLSRRLKTLVESGTRLGIAADEPAGGLRPTTRRAK